MSRIMVNFAAYKQETENPDGTKRNCRVNIGGNKVPV